MSTVLQPWTSSLAPSPTSIVVNCAQHPVRSCLQSQILGPLSGAGGYLRTVYTLLHRPFIRFPSPATTFCCGSSLSAGNRVPILGFVNLRPKVTACSPSSLPLFSAHMLHSGGRH
jgi:hypothetical protein